MTTLTEESLSALIEQTSEGRDSAHDLQHVKRVVRNAHEIGLEEGADLDILIPAAWLHDLVVLPKNSPDRNQASRISAEKAAGWLRGKGVSDSRISQICHCIEAHSFSAGIEPKTAEARILQDADRLDALGAIGIARCFVTGAGFGSAFYHPEIPLPLEGRREADDSRYSLDHFFTKLFKLPETMHTATARKIAENRTAFMKAFTEQLLSEIAASPKAQ